MENPADQPRKDREASAEEQSPAERHVLMRREREGPGNGHDHGRDHRQIDAAADHDQPHAQTQDPQDRDTANERHKIARREKIVQRERENYEQDRREGEDDAFLRDAQLTEI
jgi:hypothetical protein